MNRWLVRPGMVHNLDDLMASRPGGIVRVNSDGWDDWAGMTCAGPEPARMEPMRRDVNCRNCGAPVHSWECQCSYCGTEHQ